jgi:hypothetical protein
MVQAKLRITTFDVFLQNKKSTGWVNSQQHSHHKKLQRSSFFFNKDEGLNYLFFNCSLKILIQILNLQSLTQKIIFFLLDQKLIL